jgi:hypothetical protein
MKSAAVSSSTLGLGVILVAVLLGVLLLRENGMLPGAQSSQSPEASEVAETLPAGTDSAVASVSPSTVPKASPSSIPTTVPEASLTGDVPGPDATVPTGVPVIPGLRIEALVGLWQSVGLACRSSSGGPPGGGGGYTLHCEGADERANVEFYGEAIYFTSDGVHWVSMSIDTIDGEPIDGARAAAQLILPSVELASGAAARAWIQDRIGDSECRGDCMDIMGGTKLTLTVGRLGGYQLYLEAVA